MGWYADNFGSDSDLDELLEEYGCEENSSGYDSSDYYDRYGNKRDQSGRWYDLDGNSHGRDTPSARLRPEDIYEAEREEERDAEEFAAADDSLWGALVHLENRIDNPRWAVRAMEQMCYALTIDNPIEYAARPPTLEGSHACREEALGQHTFGADSILATFARAALNVFDDQHLFEDMGEDHACCLEFHAAEVLFELLDESALGLYHYRTVVESSEPFAVVNATKARARALLAGYLTEQHLTALKSLAASVRGETDACAQKIVRALHGLVRAPTHSAGTLAAVHWVGYACAQITGSALPQLCLGGIVEALQLPLLRLVNETDVVADVACTLRELKLQNDPARWLRDTQSPNGTRGLELNEQALSGHKMATAVASLLDCIAACSMAASPHACLPKLGAASVPQVLLCAMERWRAPATMAARATTAGHGCFAYEVQQRQRHRAAAAAAVWEAQAAAVKAVEGLSRSERGRDELLQSNGITRCASLLRASAGWPEARPEVVRPLLLALRNLCIAGVETADLRAGTIQLAAELAAERHGLELLSQGVLAHLPANELAAALCIEKAICATETAARREAEEEAKRKRDEELRKEMEQQRKQLEQARELAEKRRKEQAQRQAAARELAVRMHKEKEGAREQRWQALQRERAELGIADDYGRTGKRPLSHVSSNVGASSSQRPAYGTDRPSGIAGPPTCFETPISSWAACTCTECGKLLKTPDGMLCHRKDVHGF